MNVQWNRQPSVIRSSADGQHKIIFYANGCFNGGTAQGCYGMASSQEPLTDDQIGEALRAFLQQLDVMAHA